MTAAARLPDVKMSQVRAFLAVIEDGSFKAAALRLCKSQPAISLAIKELENLLGAALFERGSAARPTPLGEMFSPVAKRLLDEYQASLRLTMEMVDGERGAVHVASVPSLAREILPGAIAAFFLQHPKVELHLRDGHTEFVRDLVLSGEVDFGFCGRVSADARLSFTEVYNDRMGVICSADHHLADRRTIAWSELADEVVIGNGTMRLIDAPARDCMAHAERLFVANTTSLLAVVERNVGVTVLPELAYPVANSRLRYVPLDHPPVNRALGLLTLGIKSLSPVAATFKRCVLDAIGAWRAR